MLTVESLSIWVMTSPFFTPAFAAGVFFSTLRTVSLSSSMEMTNPRPPNSPRVWTFISL
jgi:hypothetical protein